MGDRYSVHSNLIKNRQMQVFLSRRCLDEQSTQSRHMSEMRFIRNENLKHNKHVPFNFAVNIKLQFISSPKTKPTMNYHYPLLKKLIHVINDDTQ